MIFKAKNTNEMTNSKFTKMYYSFTNVLYVDDDVYMEDEQLLREYILRQKGEIYRAGERYIQAKQWHFGQVLYPLVDFIQYLL